MTDDSDINTWDAESVQDWSARTNGTGGVISFTRGENPLRADKLNAAYAERVWRGGDTMYGYLTLVGPPIQRLHAATKEYVDRNAGSGTGSHDFLNVLDYGAVADGVDTGTAFTGTDNTAAFQAALNAASSAGQQVLVPPGKYRFQGVSVNNTAVLTLPTYCRISGYGATLLVDEDTSISTMALRDFMRSTGWQTTLSRTALQLCHIEGLTFQGRWSHAPLVVSTNPAAKGIHFFSVANYREVTLESVRAFDCRGQFSRTFSCETIEYRNGHFERICSDCIRAGDCNNVLVTGCFVKDTGDNSIAVHSFTRHIAADLVAFLYADRPVRSSVIVTNNRLVACVVPAFLGAHTLVFSGNILQRTHGSVAIGLQIMSGEGGNTMANVTVTNNLIEDCLHRYKGVTPTAPGSFSDDNALFDGDTGDFAPELRAQGVLVLGGAAVTKDSSPGAVIADPPDGRPGRVFPGEYDPVTQSVLSPWGDAFTDKTIPADATAPYPPPVPADPVWGYLWAVGGAIVFPPPVPPDPQPPVAPVMPPGVRHSNAGLYNLIVSGNIVVRTLPPVAKLSDWGPDINGIFVSTGYEDPPVRDVSFHYSGIVLASDARNFLITNNIIMGHRLGAGLLFFDVGFEQLSDQFFRGGMVKDNIFHDLGEGISTQSADANPAPDYNCDVVIEGNRIDLDPYHKSPFRTAPINGTWPTATVGDYPIGINCRGYKGWTIRGNTFSNMYIPVGPTLAVAYVNAHMENNLLYCDPVSVGWNVANRGIADLPPASPAFRHMIIDGNPTLATWRKVKNTIPLSAAAMPTTGTYVQGQVVAASAPVVAAGKVLLGWVRLTTGGAHVSGTDWSPLYCTVT